MPILSKTVKVVLALIALSPVATAIAIAGQKLMTLEEAVTTQQDNSTAIQEVQTNQAVMQTQQQALEKSVDQVLIEIRANRTMFMQYIQSH